MSVLVPVLLESGEVLAPLVQVDPLEFATDDKTR